MIIEARPQLLSSAHHLVLASIGDQWASAVVQNEISGLVGIRIDLRIASALQ
jgi:hypothetical protein